MSKEQYMFNVFVNCPFDQEYLKLRNALIFTIFDCGYIPRCALEEEDSGGNRFQKILRLIKESRLSIHDLSRANRNSTSFPRFNMPFELGVCIGAKEFGTKTQQLKKCLVLDREQYRYQEIISDLAGHDVSCHDDNPDNLILKVRNWLNSASLEKILMPGGEEITKRFQQFQADLPQLCEKFKMRPASLPYNDYTNLIELWLKENSPTDLSQDVKIT